MSAPTMPLSDRPLPDRHAGLKVTPARVLLSEWTKLRSLRSTLWTLLIALALLIGLGALVCALVAGQPLPADSGLINGAETSMSGLLFAQLAIGALGVLLISGEYNTGMIRASLTAVPGRLLVLWAKLGVFAAVTFVVTLVAAFVTFFLGQALLSSKHLGVSLTSPDALRIVVGAALYLTVAGVIGLAIGALLRNTAAAISGFVGLFFVLPLVANFLPDSVAKHITPYLPSNAGGLITGSSAGLTGPLSVWGGFALLCGYAVILVAVAAWRLKRADA